MIPTGVQILFALEPVDMRWSFDRLSGAAQEAVGYDARSGALFVFPCTWVMKNLSMLSSGSGRAERSRPLSTARRSAISWLCRMPRWPTSHCRPTRADCPIAVIRSSV